MFGILNATFRTATREDIWGNHKTPPTHASELWGHEARKRDELRRQNRHALLNRFRG